MLKKPQTKTRSRASLRAMSLILVGSFFVLPGCQTFKSTFTSMPKLPSASDLAFWKKESDTAPPPPPAQHLSPSSTRGFGELADLGERNGIDIDEYRQKIDDMKDNIASAESKLGSQSPLRTPYGDTFKSDLQASGNQIDKGFAAATEKAKSFGSGTKNLGSSTLSDAQNRFNAAIADVKKPLDDSSLTDNGFRAPKDILSTKPVNDFKQALADTGSQLKTGVESGFNAAKKNIGFDEKVGQVNNSLYDMHGNLTTAAKTAPGKVASSVDAARQRFSSALGTVSDKAMEAAKTSTDFGGDLKNKIVAAASEIQPPLRGGDNSFKPAFGKAIEQGASKARNLIDNAKKEVAGLGTGFDFPEPPTPQTQPPAVETSPAVTAPKTQLGGNFVANQPAPSNSETFGGGTFNRTRVANVTPANVPDGGTFARPSGLDSSLTKAWNNGSRQSNLKPIDVGNTTSTPGNALRTVSAVANDFSSRAATIPAAFDEGRNATTSHIADVDIPSKILSGSGSYAPGSVNKVR